MPSFNLADLFEVVADAVPDRLALVADGGPAARLTYAGLDARANRVAHHLAAAGIGPGDHVAILARNRAEWVESMIGCYKLRAAPVNVNHRYVAGELTHLLADSASVALIAEKDLLPGVEHDRLPALRHVLAIDGDYEDALAAASPGRGFAPRSSDDPYLLYTGGTTGLPKGVLWRCEDIFVAAMGGGNFGGPPVADPAELAACRDRDGLRTQVHAPLMHGGGQWITWITLTTGGTVVLWTGARFDAAAALDLAVRERSQILMLVGNGMAAPIADVLDAAGPGGIPGLAVFAFGSGGAPLSDAVKARLLAAVPNAYVSDNLGGSETGAMGASEGGGRFRLGPEFAVLGPDLRPVAPGEEGVVARTGHIPSAYWNDPDKTAATFVTGPDGRRWALQGDHARAEPDGSTTLLGRGSLVINTGGEKVFAEEVETALRAHPGVADAVVVGTPDERLGHRVTAVVALQPGGPSPDALTAHARTRLAGYKVPRAYVVVPEIRRTPVGKPDYAWARAQT
ncbi:AMP-binding protein [Actinomadura parmotrematis]|uniref:AMP-binding protein n=1 Tax=Actinomadura parmotrematis TaxID=2864039 RepID=A0ABS7FUA3_9ACTN|nr:AMP-binding protein [Actinomadura parmotrematis]MBW8483988.1 AMP-binding protein [Actinomadura parmotrematis]